RRKQADVEAGQAGGQDLDHIGDGGAAGGGHNSDPARKGRQRAFAPGREQPLGGQFLLELLERQLQRAQTLRFQHLHLQLVFAAEQGSNGRGQLGDAENAALGRELELEGELLHWSMVTRWTRELLILDRGEQSL